MSMHLPARPAWTCQACGLAWPCATRRGELAAEFAGARVSMMLYLSGMFVQACQDQPNEQAGELYQQFLAWPRRMPRNSRWW
jgi:hypothetical protein